MSAGEWAWLLDGPICGTMTEQLITLVEAQLPGIYHEPKELFIQYWTYITYKIVSQAYTEILILI